MNIVIKNCNNIKSAEIRLEEKKLNVKYAINGTGKSSIAKSILFYVNDKNKNENTLKELKPYSTLNDDSILPEIKGIDNFHTVKIFNDDYVSSNIFEKDELIKDSFDIFIRTKEYENGLSEIEKLVQEIKNILKNDKEIESLKNDFGEIVNAFGRDTKKGLHGSSALAKAFKDGNKIENIPEGLEIFSDYIKSPENFKWIKWQLDGQSFIDLTENCPYCVTNIKEKKEIIKKVSQSYDAKIIENLNKIVMVFQRLNDYFSESTKKIISSFVKNVDGYTSEQVDFIKEVKDQIERLRSKFDKAQNIGFYSLKDVDKVVDELKEYHIDIKLYNHLESEKTIEKVSIVNKALDEISKKAGLLQGCIKRQQQLINTIVEDNKTDINTFLQSAGYEYSVDLVEEVDGTRKLKLVYNENNYTVSSPKSHLSFGEKNAISLILFMYDALKANPDLIILDDPISSFDKNKKYAMIDMLFKKEKFLKGKTVLMLTHDTDPIVDMMLVHSDKFDLPFSTFLENQDGILVEKEIKKEDIKTFIEICKNNIETSQNNLNKLVYYRRLNELTKNNSLGYQLVSNLFHKREQPEIHKEGKIIMMSLGDIANAEKEIEKIVTGFVYKDYLNIVKNDNLMIENYKSAPNNYEKLHIYRIIFDDKESLIKSDAIKKFVNESFHIENNYIYQLDPCKYQTVPQYIINICDKHIKMLEEEI